MVDWLDQIEFLMVVVIGIDGISGEIKYDPGLGEVAVLNGICGDRDDRKLSNS